MDLEMLDGYLTAVVSGPEAIQPSEWLPQVWSEGSKSAAPVFVDNDQAQRIMGLVLRHFVGIQRTLAESPTRFRPLLYVPDDKVQRGDRTPAEATAWCEGYMAGVKLRDDEWQPLYDAQGTRLARGTAAVKLGASVDEKLAALQKEVEALAGQEINLGSPKQLQELLFEKLGLPVLGTDSTPTLQRTIQHSVYKGFAAPIALYGLLGFVMLRNRKKEGEHA